MIVIGIDIGTTGTKALAVDESGRVRGRGYMEYEIAAPKPGWAEQNAEDWWNASLHIVRQALAQGNIRPEEISAISLSTQGASMVTVDGNGNPLAPVITWMDSRAGKETGELSAALGAENTYKKTGWMPSASLDAAKILWLRRNEPELYRRTARFVSTLEFMNQRLTGRCVVDPTNAAIRQLYHVREGVWDTDILDFLELDPEKLPEIAPSGAFLGTLTKPAAESLGLPETVRVYNGAHDQYCAAIGSGTVHAGDILLATGTAWVVFGLTGEFMYENPRFAPGAFPHGRGFAALASVPCGGAALKWWKSICGEDYPKLDSIAKARMESAKDLLFYPYLAGKESLTASFRGLTLAHDKYDLARAIMEGVVFESRILLDGFPAQKNGRIIMTGGAAESIVWRGISAEVLGREVLVPQEAQAACLGAAVLAAVGEQWFLGIEDCVTALVRHLPSFIPASGAAEFYQKKFMEYFIQIQEV